MRERQDGLLAEIYDKVCQIQIKPLHLRPEPRTSVPSFDEERSIASLYSPGSLEGPRAGGRGRASTEGSVSSPMDDSGKDHSDGNGLQPDDRQLAEKRKVRGSYRHSFVRKAQLKHEETAAAASLHLASLKAYSLNAAPETGALRALGQAVVTSSVFTGTITFLIFLNVVLLGVEVDMSANLGQDQVPLWFGTVNAIIVLIFVLEVFLKCLAYGLHEFWCGADSKWNIFDSCIIAVSVVDTNVDIWAQMMAHSMATSTHLRLMRSLRLARALRGVRVVRLFRYVSALRTLVLCIVSTMASLVWTLVLLVLIFYTFGVILTQLVTDHCRDATVLNSGDLNAVPSCDASLARYWQSVPHSMLTLFMSISGGVSWEDALRPLEAVSPLAAGLMVCYIVLTVLAVLNVVTGVFCNTAIESAHADKDVAAIKQIHKQAAQVQSLQQLGKEFEEAMSQQKMASFLQSMGISTGPAQADMARDCVSGFVPGTLHKMLRRLKARLEEDGVTTEIQAAIKHTIETIEPSRQTEAAGQHQVEAVAWPGEEWTVKFLCHRCGTLADAEANIKGKCSRLGVRRPMRARRGRGSSQLARYNLERLGYPIRPKDSDTEAAQLAAGLRQGP
ncbi:scn4ab [Symbiodinium sp. CCMP2456]|nr:scn4ab [Symbiodinium sp. CCMP2456]